MAEIETIGVLEEIRALVSDQLQVVSYKWLSRNFLFSSNAAKRLLQEVVEKHGSGLEVVYALSGWLKNSPPCYHIRLVTAPKLQEAKQEFDGNCSVQVYSVQSSIPKDPAALWNAEFIQAEGLFKDQPSTVDNCLRDNRFSAISNSFVKRNVDGVSVSTSAAQSKSTVISGLSKTNSAQQNITVPPPQQIKVQEPSPKCPGEKEKVHLVPTNKKKGPSDKGSSGTGSSLANLWGRASAKSKANNAQSPSDDIGVVSNPIVSAEAQICSREVAEVGSSDDDGEGLNFQRTSNGGGGRKRRVVFDLSDDEFEDAVNLASPDPPKEQSLVDSKQNEETLVTVQQGLIFDDQKEEKPNVEEEKATDKESDKSLKDSLVFSKSSNIKISSETESYVPANDAKMDKVKDTAPNSPKRRKVLKTRIDERGREVNEVVWEGEESETTKKADNNATKNPDNSTTTNVVNRPPAKKSPAVVNTAPSKVAGKGGNKKASSKDPKQGNILSFFKKAG